MRLFFGLPFPHQARRDFRLVQKVLETRASKGNFTAVSNFHLTLSFLGEVEEDNLPTLFSILERVKPAPFDLLFTRLDHFDGGIWYLAPAPCPPLLDFRQRLDEALRQNRFSPEDRPYTPHLTLGRKILLPGDFHPAGPLPHPIPAHSDGPRLFLSHRVEGVLTYTPLTP